MKVEKAIEKRRSYRALDPVEIHFRQIVRKTRNSKRRITAGEVKMQYVFSVDEYSKKLSKKVKH